jgi:hypothetical protein
MTPSLWWFSGIGATCFFVGLVWCYRAAWKDADQESRMWERRARAAGWMPSISEAKAHALMSDLFPGKFMRPLGARPREDAASLSTQADVSRLREWREHRATKGIDHHTRHFAEGAVASEWATEVMQLCVGPLEIEGGE